MIFNVNYNIILINFAKIITRIYMVKNILSKNEFNFFHENGCLIKKINNTIKKDPNFKSLFNKEEKLSEIELF